MSRVSILSIASRLQAMGFSGVGARQLATGEVLSDAKDRRRLALFLAGLLEVDVIRPGNSNGSTFSTQSGIVITIQDESSTAGGTITRKSSVSTGRTVSVERTRSGVVVGFEDVS